MDENFKNTGTKAEAPTWFDSKPPQKVFEMFIHLKLWLRRNMFLDGTSYMFSAIYDVIICKDGTIECLILNIDVDFFENLYICQVGIIQCLITMANAEIILKFSFI